MAKLARRSAVLLASGLAASSLVVVAASAPASATAGEYCGTQGVGGTAGAVLINVDYGWNPSSSTLPSKDLPGTSLYGDGDPAVFVKKPPGCYDFNLVHISSLQRRRWGRP